MTAPLYNDLAEGPDDGTAAWVETSDKRRLRAAVWGAGAPKGTVFLFTGRSEYVEKYGRTAASLKARGYATLTFDWRGQGLSSRVLPNYLPGHVDDFDEYQRDVAAILAFAGSLSPPEPWFLLCHSMGGCIGLRTLLSPHPFRAAALTAPMWGIRMLAWQKPVVEVSNRLALRLGKPHIYAPSTGPLPYVTTAPFMGNMLTTDPDMWAYMARHLKEEPKLAMGGPTMAWLRAALDECASLARLPSPDFPTYAGLGSHERVVDSQPILDRMEAWPSGRLDIYEGDEHEILMERDREVFLDRMETHFAAHA